MDAIANILLAAGAIGAAVYCIVLSRRLKRFTDLEKGIGGAVAVLSAQVDDLTRMLARARERAGESTQALATASARAEAAAGRIELLLAALHDLPDPTPAPVVAPAQEAGAPAVPPPPAPVAPIPRVFVRQTEPAEAG